MKNQSMVSEYNDSESISNCKYKMESLVQKEKHTSHVTEDQYQSACS